MQVRCWRSFFFKEKTLRPRRPPGVPFNRLTKHLKNEDYKNVEHTHYSLSQKNEKYNRG